MATHFIAADLVKIYTSPQKSTAGLKTVLAWGDEVVMIEAKGHTIKIALQDYKEQPDGSILPVQTEGYIIKPSAIKTEEILLPLKDKNVLKVSFADVGQGDASVIETPKGKTILIDGGENQLFARYLAARYAGTSAKNPKTIDCIIVSHGDADHFSGLPEIMQSESHAVPRKRIFIKPISVYHNGLVKRLSSAKEKDLLGATMEHNGQLYLTGMVNRLDEVPDPEMNTVFKRWKNVLAAYEKRYQYSILQKRLDHTSKGDFNFLSDEKISVHVLGPVTDIVENKPVLRFLHQPSSSVAQKAWQPAVKSAAGAYSASHTINGHSVILRLSYGKFNFLFAGDLNEEAEDYLVANKRRRPVKADVLKVPHHGSADFSSSFLDAVNPFVSIISSGDENARKEYIHPRATLIGALGKYSRIDRPLIFVTEMVAFMKTEGWAKLDTPKKGQSSASFFAFSRAAYGIVHIRTDGSRMLIFTHSGQKDLKEAYAYTLDKPNGTPVRNEVVMV